MNRPRARKIFVSSTSKDLPAERAAVEEALNQMRDTEFLGMEYFGSRPGNPKSVCMKEVEESDVYIGIIADRYGYVDPETGISMTELEYRRARASEIPCLIYIKDSGAVNPEARPGDDPLSGQKLRALKEEIQREHTITFFKTPEQLATKVILDLHNLFDERGSSHQPQRVEAGDLYAILDTRFDMEELRTLCFQLSVDFDNLRGEGKSSKVRELIKYLERRDRLPNLFPEMKKLRPDIA
jgi:hypothetical protein